jgi:hypothetical protein
MTSSDHHQKGDAQAELFADEVAEAFAGDHAHAGAHLLHDDQGQGDGNHGPEQRVAVLRAGLRVGEDAAGVVVDVGGDEAGPRTARKSMIRIRQRFQTQTLKEIEQFKSLYGMTLKSSDSHNLKERRK